MIQNERTHFVLVNSEHYLRYLMLDQDHMVSFNSSSVLTNVDVSDAKMATIGLLPRGSGTGKRSYKNDVVAGVYDKRTVKFQNVTGRVYVNAEASHYLTDFTKQTKSSGR